MSVPGKAEIVWGICFVLFKRNILLSHFFEGLLINLNTEIQVNGGGEVCMGEPEFWKKPNKDQPALATNLTQAYREPFRAAVCTKEV